MQNLTQIPRGNILSAFIAQGFANDVNDLYNRLANYPVPSTPVYGRTPIFTPAAQTTPTT